MGPRWKGKDAETKALADPMSKIASQLQSSLLQSNVHGFISGCSVLLSVEAEQAELLMRACFGKPVVTAEKNKQWFQLCIEEAFYLCYSLKCLKIVGENGCLKNDLDLWLHMKSKRENFPDFYKAYSHLRMKNWVIRPGLQYGVDFVAYRHHPSLVHSEYAVIVLSEGDGDANLRLRVWSDFHCTLRLCGSVAKTLLVLGVDKNGHGTISPSCLEGYTVGESTITRWSPEQNRSDQIAAVNGTKSEVLFFYDTANHFQMTSRASFMRTLWKGSGFCSLSVEMFVARISDIEGRSRNHVIAINVDAWFDFFRPAIVLEAQGLQKATVYLTSGCKIIPPDIHSCAPSICIKRVGPWNYAATIKLGSAFGSWIMKACVAACS